MRIFLLVLGLLAWITPAFAATTYGVPITAVPGSLMGEVSGHPVPTSLPFSAPIITAGPCTLGRG